MRVVVAVTDSSWVAHLRSRPDLTEANFWLPSPVGSFRAISSGEPFLFKSKWPDNRLVGGGYLSGYTTLTVREAWDLFGYGNGVSSQEHLLRSIHQYRPTTEPDPRIGCVLLRDIFFCTPGPDAPPDFSKNIVKYKTYDLSTPAGAYVREAMGHMFSTAEDRASSVPGVMFGDPRLTIPRLGQGAFRGMVLTAYNRQCAITGGRIQPVLQAAHIRPVASAGEHRLSNGLLLRSDVHTLFDRGYIGIDEQHRLQVSARLREDFGNGREFYDRAGTEILLPSHRADRPARADIQWHMDTVFLH